MNIGKPCQTTSPREEHEKLSELAEAIGRGCRKHLLVWRLGRQKQFTEQTLSRLADCLGVYIAQPLFTRLQKGNTFLYVNTVI